MHWMMIVGWTVALAFVAISAVINALFLSSLGRTFIEASVLAMLSVVADAAKAVLPVLMLAAWRNGHRRTASLGGVVLGALIGLSIMSGMGFAAMTRSAVATLQGMTAMEIDMTTSAIRRSETSLAALGPVRPASVIEAELAGAMTDRMWALSQGCAAPASRSMREHCTRVSRLRTELGAAEAAQRIEEALSGQRARLAALREGGASGAADPQVTAAAELLGISAQAARLAMTAGLAVVIELGAVVLVLIVSAAAAVNGAQAQPATPPVLAQQREAVSAEPAPLPLPPKSRQWLKRQQAMREKGRDDVHAAT